MVRVQQGRLVSLIFLMAVVGFGPRYAQRHDPAELASLRGEVNQLYSEGNYAEAIPLAERYFTIARQRHGQGHSEFETAIAWLATIYYAQVVRCLGAETRPGELTLRPHSH